MRGRRRSPDCRAFLGKRRGDHDRISEAQVELAAPIPPKPADFRMTVRRVRTMCGLAIRPPG